MQSHEKKKAIAGLGKFIKKLVREVKPNDRDGLREWKKKNERFMEKCFWYTREPGMPSITALVKPFFHPTEPLVGLNYTPVAHLTLHKFAEEGWTLPLRLCRGIIFNHNGTLVAMAFPKFFNYGEHPETQNLPNEPFVATTKHDGHLGIIFWHQGKLSLTTRGDFRSPTSLIGNQMLQQYVQQYQWGKQLPWELTVLVEIIHPRTKVHLVYRKPRFILLGANHIQTLEDYDYEKLLALSQALRIPITEKWQGTNLEELKQLVSNKSVGNREGFVARFSKGLRIKFKFLGYIQKMIKSKLSYSYIINRIMDDKLEKMMLALEEELYGEAEKMAAQLKKVKDLDGSDKEKLEYLYGLAPEKQRTDSYRAKCRKFLNFIKKSS